MFGYCNKDTCNGCSNLVSELYVIQDVVLKTRCFLICIGCNCYFCALLYILCMLWVFIVTRVIVTGF